MAPKKHSSNIRLRSRAHPTSSQPSPQNSHGRRRGYYPPAFPVAYGGDTSRRRTPQSAVLSRQYLLPSRLPGSLFSGDVSCTSNIAKKKTHKTRQGRARANCGCLVYSPKAEKIENEAKHSTFSCDLSETRFWIFTW